MRERLTDIGLWVRVVVDRAARRVWPGAVDVGLCVVVAALFVVIVGTAPMDGPATLLSPTTALVIAAVWYSLETREQRRIAASNLDELRAEQARARETYVRVSRWSGRNHVEVTNYGPAPALNIKVFASYTPQYGGATQRRFLEGKLSGLAVGVSTPLELNDGQQQAGWPNDTSEHITTRVLAQTVLQKDMPHKDDRVLLTTKGGKL